VFCIGNENGTSSFPPASNHDWYPSRLFLLVQPEEGIVLGFQAKYPGPKMLLRPVEMRFSYKESFDAPSPDAYETLLLDVMNIDPILFRRADQIEAAWHILMPVLEEWAKTQARSFPNYAAGTWEPKAADELFSCDGCEWRPIG
jgi:glucose-6-phosphate 1-dehydrogenase